MDEPIGTSEWAKRADYAPATDRMAAHAAPLIRRMAAARLAITRLLAGLRSHAALLLGMGMILLALIPIGGLDVRAGLAAWAVMALSLALLWPGRGRRRHGLARGADAARALPVESLGAMLEAMPQPAMLLGPTGGMLMLNSRARDLFGPARLGQHVSAHIRHPEFLEAVERICNLRPPEPIAVRYDERIPVDRHIEAILAWLSNAGESRAVDPAILVSMTDLTERERVNQLRADFVANASHELRTPLASLIGFIETLQGPAANDPPARERFLRIMGSQAQRMKRLIDDLMSLTRVEMHAHVPPRELVEINEAIRNVVEALEPLAREAAVTLSAVPTGRPVRVRGDREELMQVFQNLVHNAIKYGREGGLVTIMVDREYAGSGREPPRIAIEVKDDGPGIAPRHLPRLTERFYRVDTTASRSKGGTGLGLAIVKHVLARHRGELKIVSKLGEGSTFTVLLPAQGDHHSLL